MHEKFKCKIATPLGNVFDSTVERVTIPTESGEITVLAHHEPLVALARKGAAILEIEDSSEKHFELGEGVVEMRRDGTLLLLLESAVEK
ncbi:MAG: F0F1 ATP synthase subunit epsilon [Candidatus Campbellbacteria bacterium]|nr:F0F1 ATP synthase subunit epsilon [Candidatus Campbellbacteria bacterium]